eukprot:TRINITY_DN136291_c0_g1_i1.p1 TRINITY_DN136291_c0_g1~~TRINITY_DN136291_c0_g1_i1.p1  ORF type:complete len:511 (-),score=36.49 TRINITY_DN136291_c0_g1_i1:126-1571(-)
MKRWSQLLKPLKPFLWELEPSPEFHMNVPARIYATKDMLTALSSDSTLQQLINVAGLPGVVKHAIAMPDAHQGYGFPIGGVAATEYPHGVISPGGIGYDINCGVRLLISSKFKEDVSKTMKEFTTELLNKVPTGTGRKGPIELSLAELNTVLSDGALWTVKKGLAEPSDLECIESRGTLLEATPETVSTEAKARGLDQLGTLGSGNHFIEIGYVEQIFDTKVATTFGLQKDLVTVMIHTGSRGLGHQTATDYIKHMRAFATKNGFKVPDKQLVCAPLNSEVGRKYFGAMCAAANFAFANRQAITFQVRKLWKKFFGKNEELKLLYDVAHNIAKIETHKNSSSTRLIVHRKGATRAFGPNHPELPKRYIRTGQPIIIPGSMGTASYALVGTEKSMEEAWGSCCHGAGRTMSREKAKKTFKARELKKTLEKVGMVVGTKSLADLGEEAPGAYKDVEGVVNVVSMAGIARKVAKIKPFAVIKQN